MTNWADFMQIRGLAHVCCRFRFRLRISFICYSGERLPLSTENSTLAKILFEDEDDVKPPSPFLFYDPPEKAILASLNPTQTPIVGGELMTNDFMNLG